MRTPHPAHARRSGCLPTSRRRASGTSRAWFSTWFGPRRESERVLDRRRDEVAIVQVVEPTRAAELRPGHIECPGGLQVRLDTQREAIAALHEAAARSRRGALHVMLPVETRQDVPGAHEARIFEPTRDAISIGRRVGEAVLRLDEVQVQAG